ncbi:MULTISPECIES: Uma2 family endonuclease [unclassified Microcoleus]|uniref:Uma2 family endonuclease n=1 Tax=unclassified Microcoleus TaxID=2642155 RepID=UPI00312B4500
MVAQHFYISPEDYLEAERVSPIKHEYRRGRVYAMAGAKKPHVVLSSNLSRLLGNHLDSTPCLVMASDIKVRLETADCYYYPDVVVTCHPEDITTTEDFIRYPKLIIEVLSKSTANFDSTEKFADYQTCSTLEDYVLVSQTQQQIVHYTLKDGLWLRHEVTDRVGVERSQFLYLPSVDCELTLPDIYRKVPGFEA